MKFGYTIVYVPDVPVSLKFFNDAFGIPTRFLHESNTYGELDTGTTALAFAEDAMGEAYFANGYVSAHASEKPLGIAIALVTEDVVAAHGKAISVGATQLSEPQWMPWGQTVSYVRCPDGSLVELCSPVFA